MSFSIGAWADPHAVSVNIIGCGVANAYDDECDISKITVRVKPDPGFTTRLAWITVTNKTTGGQYTTSVDDKPAYDPNENGNYGGERDITLYVAKPVATDMSLPEPAYDNVVVTVCFKGGLKLQSNLANATVTWYDGGNTEPVAASFNPESLTALTADHLYVSESSYDERKDHYVIAKVVPGAGNWTDASLLRSFDCCWHSWYWNRLIPQFNPAEGR